MKVLLVTALTLVLVVVGAVGYIFYRGYGLRVDSSSRDLVVGLSIYNRSVMFDCPLTFAVGRRGVSFHINRPGMSSLESSSHVVSFGL